MGFRFQRRIKILPGVRLNVSKSGFSISAGGRGFTVNSRGTATVGIPGTGLSYRANLNQGNTARATAPASQPASKALPSSLTLPLALAGALGVGSIVLIGLIGSLIDAATPKSTLDQLLKYRSANEICSTTSPQCEWWQKTMLVCEKSLASGVKHPQDPCTMAEKYREEVTGVANSSDPRAYAF